MTEAQNQAAPQPNAPQPERQYSPEELNLIELGRQFEAVIAAETGASIRLTDNQSLLETAQHILADMKTTMASQIPQPFMKNPELFGALASGLVRPPGKGSEAEKATAQRLAVVGYNAVCDHLGHTMNLDWENPSERIRQANARLLQSTFQGLRMRRANLGAIGARFVQPALAHISSAAKK